ncbi:cadherin-like domain-containing protein [Vibrio chagasii]|nr:cadherin-like domain-containing protein [Vibrio chagasii]
MATSSDIEGDVSIDGVTYSGGDGVMKLMVTLCIPFSQTENFSGEIALDVVVADEDGATDTATTAGITVLGNVITCSWSSTSYTIEK